MNEGRAQSAKCKAQGKKKNLPNRSVPDSIEILSMAIS